MTAVITFKLAGRMFGIEIERIGEILTFEELFKAPGSKDWFVGVMNVRGSAMPIVDLRILFKTNLTPLYDKNTVIIAIKAEEGKRVGYIIDEIRDILSLDGTRTFQPAENYGVEARFIKGYIIEGEQTIAVLDADKLKERSDMQEYESVGE